MAAIDDLTALLANLPGADLLTNTQKLDALAVSLMPDLEGRWPGEGAPVLAPVTLVWPSGTKVVLTRTDNMVEADISLVAGNSPQSMALPQGFAADDGAVLTTQFGVVTYFYSRDPDMGLGAGTVQFLGEAPVAVSGVFRYLGEAAPGGYIPTYDIYWAAIQLTGWLMAQPVIRQSSSEGTSIAVDAPNWGALLAYYRSMSPIYSASGAGVLNLVPIPDVPHVVPTDMMSRGDGYGDVDTDLT